MVNQNYRTRGKRTRLDKGCKVNIIRCLHVGTLARGLHPRPLMMEFYSLWHGLPPAPAPLRGSCNRGSPISDSAHLSLLLPNCSPLGAPLSPLSPGLLWGPPAYKAGLHSLVPAVAVLQVSPTGSVVPGRSWAVVGSCSRTFYDGGTRLPRAHGGPQRTMGPDCPPAQQSLPLSQLSPHPTNAL